jgi:hypothetical protein
LSQLDANCSPRSFFCQNPTNESQHTQSRVRRRDWWNSRRGLAW